MAIKHTVKREPRCPYVSDDSTYTRHDRDDEWRCGRLEGHPNEHRLYTADGEKILSTNGTWKRKCPDSGACHHGCPITECFRVQAAAPLSFAGYPGDTWPWWIKNRYGQITPPEPEETIVKDQDFPHSRACGIRLHTHGTSCHPNCPTCQGRLYWDIQAGPEVQATKVLPEPADNEQRSDWEVGVLTYLLNHLPEPRDPAALDMVPDWIAAVAKAMTETR